MTRGRGHAPGGNAQSLAPGNVLGKILRINPLGRNAANGRYGIPADNPLVGKAGPAEVYAWGFRNPFRMSFDTLTGLLVVPDVGQNDIEEINLVQAGRNYGWPIKEGSFLVDTGACLTPPHGFVYQNSPGAPGALTDPFTQYDHCRPARWARAPHRGDRRLRLPRQQPAGPEGPLCVWRFLRRGEARHGPPVRGWAPAGRSRN